MNRAINWIKNNVHPDGGIRSQAGGQAYPEVTGYLIPTLVDWGEKELAHEFAAWLKSIQDKDGSFKDLNGIKRTFDTAACWEGLNYIKDPAAEKARTWLHDQHKDGEFWTGTEKTEKAIYTLRINGLLGIPAEIPDTLIPNRSHYILYALEGLWMLGELGYVTEKLEWLERKLFNGFMPYFIYEDRVSSKVDLCATAQFGYLAMLAGMGDLRILESLNSATLNGYYNSWTAKFHLDLMKQHELEIL